MTVSDYVSLAQAKSLARLASTNTDYDAVFCDVLIPRISRQIDDYCRRHFYELVATYYFDYQDPWRLGFGSSELLAVTTFTNGDSETLTENTEYILYPMSGPPYRWADIKRDSGEVFQWSDTKQRAISIAGKWGYHTDYGNAWQASVDSIQNTGGITAAGTSITVSNASLFSERQTIKIESEQLLITARDQDADSITVERAINGTTAAAHDKDTAISRWRVPSVIAGACAEWATFVLNTAPDSGISRLRMGDYEEATSFFLLEQASAGPPGSVKPALKPYRLVNFWHKR